MTRESRRRAEAEQRGRENAARDEPDRYYILVGEERDPDRPRGLIRILRGGREEQIGPGAVWTPTEGALDGQRAMQVDAVTAERAAARWAYEYRRIAERGSGRTVAWVRFWIRPYLPLFRVEVSTCRSGIWEPTGRLWRIDRDEDDYAVETVDAATVEDALRDVSPPEYRYFAVVHDGQTDHGLNRPAEILRVRTGQENGARERLGDGWEPYDMIDGVNGLRRLTLLEVGDEAVAEFRPPAPGPADEHRYVYHEILHPSGSRPLAVVRRDVASGRGEEAAVGWPVWSPSKWLEQIAAGKVAYRARETDPAAVERFLRQAAADRPEFRYFAILDGDEGIDSAWSMVRTHLREDGEPWKEEVQLKDGSWWQTFHLHEISSGRGSWWQEAVEVPRWMFDDYRARRR